MRKLIVRVLTVFIALFVIGVIAVPVNDVRADGTAHASGGSSWENGDGSSSKQFNVSLSGVDPRGGPISISVSLEGNVTGLSSYWGCDSCSLSGNSVNIYISGNNLYNGGVGFIVNYEGVCSVARGSTSISFSQSAGVAPTDTPTPTPTTTPTPTPTPTQAPANETTSATTAATTAATTVATQPAGGNSGGGNAGGGAAPDQPQPEVVYPVEPAPQDPGAPVVVPVDSADSSVEVTVESETSVQTEPVATQVADNSNGNSGNSNGDSGNGGSTETTPDTTEETTVPIVIIDVNGNEIIVTPTPKPTPVPRFIAMFTDPNDDMYNFPWWIVNALLIAAVVIARLVALKIQGARGADYIIDFVPFGIVRGIVDNVQYAQEKRRRMREPEKNNGYMEREHNHVNSSASAAEAAKAAQAARAEFARAAAERNAASASSSQTPNNGMKAPIKRPPSAANSSASGNATTYRPSPLKRPSND